jgi:hypothetical protein
MSDLRHEWDCFYVDGDLTNGATVAMDWGFTTHPRSVYRVGEAALADEVLRLAARVRELEGLAENSRKTAIEEAIARAEGFARECILLAEERPGGIMATMFRAQASVLRQLGQCLAGD